MVHHWIPPCLKLPIQMLRSPGASRLHDLRNRRGTEHAVLGKPPTEPERLDAWQDPESRETATIWSSFPTITRSRCCTGTLTRNHSFRSILLEILSVLHLMSMVVRFRDSSGRFLPRSDSHQSAHGEVSRFTLAYEMNQGLLLGLDSQLELTSQIML